VVAIFSSSEVKTMVLATAIRALRGGGSVTLIERRADPVQDLLTRVRASAPEVAVLLLLTPSAYADADEIRAVAGEVTVIDALEAAADFLVHDIRRHRLLAHHGERTGRITAFATRGGTTGITREPLSTASSAALQRRI
jgi:hypothetical protein